MAAVGFSVVIIGGIVAFYLLSKVPLPEALPPAATSFVYASDGSLLAELHGEENRIIVPYADAEYDYYDLPQHLIDAVVAREDRRFFEHNGVDAAGIARAAWNDIRNKPVQGGSTIPQQYVKNVFLDDERSLMRKVKEATIAIKLSRKFPKEEIMSMYLNTIYFGRGAYGIESAALAYFDKSARDLSLNESAFLAGAISAPNSADPIENPDEALRRRNVTLDAMVQTGALDPATAAIEQFAVDEKGLAVPRPVEATETTGEELAYKDGGDAYFTEFVRQELVDRFGRDTVYRGGLRVTTTIDPDVQDSAERAASEILDRSDDPDVAMVTLDSDGRIRAMVGGRDFNESQVNLAVGRLGGGSGRQPGSTFKPIVFATAMSKGVAPTKTFPAPARITLDVPNSADEVWNISNDGDASYGGSMSIVSATINSVNTVYGQLILDVGVDETVQMAYDLGIESELPPAPAIALGAGEVSPLDMATVYNTFLNVGERVETSAIERVTDASGDVIFDSPPSRTRVLTEEQATNVIAVLRNVVSRGTGTRAQIGDMPIAGKTGTTQDYGDAWFIGFTPRYVTSVWVGYKEGNERKLTNVHGRRVYGGTFPAMIWKAHMQRIMDGIEQGEFPTSSDIRASTGSRPSGGRGDSSSVPTTSPPSVAPSPSAVIDTVPDEETPQPLPDPSPSGDIVPPSDPDG